MQIIVRTDRNIQGDDALTGKVSDVVEKALGRLSARLTRVEVHLSDENSDKRGGDDDMRCMMEADLKGTKPMAVTHRAATLDEAVDAAAGKLARLVENTFDRINTQERRRTDPPLDATQHPE